MKYIPLILTIFRLVMSVTLLPFFLFKGLSTSNFICCNYTLSGVVALLALTDFLDGYIARKYKCETSAGKWLDPISDKVFVTSVLFVLMNVGRIWSGWVVVFLTRELIVSLLRFFARWYYINVSVSGYGKLKSVLQYFYLIVAVGAPWTVSFVLIESSLLFLLLYSSLAVSAFSGCHYIFMFFHEWNKK
jgi:CDP-diacylglycerol--glycerol-3-phosphate 3-phosphatidyltransferase